MSGKQEHRAAQKMKWKHEVKDLGKRAALALIVPTVLTKSEKAAMAIEKRKQAAKLKQAEKDAAKSDPSAKSKPKPKLGKFSKASLGKGQKRDKVRDNVQALGTALKALRGHAAKLGLAKASKEPKVPTTPLSKLGSTDSLEASKQAVEMSTPEQPTSAQCSSLSPILAKAQEKLMECEIMKRRLEKEESETKAGMRKRKNV